MPSGYVANPKGASDPSGAETAVGADPLQERGVDGAIGEPALGRVDVVDRREDVRVRIEVADLEEDALGAAYADQEVMDQSDPGMGTGSFRHTHSSSVCAMWSAETSIYPTRTSLPWPLWTEAVPAVGRSSPR